MLNKAAVELHQHSDLTKTINAAILCNDAEFSKDHRGKWHIHGNPVDKALLDLGGKVNLVLI